MLQPIQFTVGMVFIFTRNSTGVHLAFRSSMCFFCLFFFGGGVCPIMLSESLNFCLPFSRWAVTTGTLDSFSSPDQDPNGIYWVPELQRESWWLKSYCISQWWNTFGSQNLQFVNYFDISLNLLCHHRSAWSYLNSWLAISVVFCSSVLFVSRALLAQSTCLSMSMRLKQQTYQLMIYALPLIDSWWRLCINKCGNVPEDH